jgi:hypothetical protein
MECQRLSTNWQRHDRHAPTMTSRWLWLLFAFVLTGVFLVEAQFPSVASLTRPGAGATTYTYNALGNLLTNGEQGGSTYTYPTTEVNVG